MKRTLLATILILFSLISSGCTGGFGQESPEGVVQLAIQTKANDDKASFTKLIIDEKDFLWDKIINCKGKSVPNFTYNVEKTQYLGQNLTVVRVYDGNRENGGLVVTKIDNKWYLSDWVGEISCN